MATQWGFLVKMLVGSTGLSLLIKYGAPALSLTPTTALSLVFVLAPSLMVAAILGWRTWSSP